ncbi:MAG: hypothetical protein F6J97_01165 [Leptolyngbya sp. SIO4C1]|nr:hypothetical protein [Leptolyngbya sp. SIO4C1]
MAENPQQQRDNFIMPRASYRGKFTPENLVFNSNLQEFASRVSLICSLETGGKISSADAYEQIRALWKELKASKKNLVIDEDSEPPTDPAAGS